MRNTPYRRGPVRNADLAVYLRGSAADNSSQYQHLRHCLQRAVREELTEKQRFAVIQYYQVGKNIREIAQELGVDKSTVSRTLKRARLRLRHVLSYSFEHPPD